MPDQPVPPLPPYPPPPPSPYAPSPYSFGPPPPPMPRRQRSAGFWVAVIGGSIAAVLVLFGLLTWAAVRSVGSDGTTSASGDSIGVIEVSGVLLSAEGLDTQLRKFGDDNDVKAIILHINSPGGGAAVSQELYNEVLRIRKEKHKKIIASIETVGASGAYYIASACDRIYANDASVVGVGRRDHGVDAVRRSAALGQAEACGAACR